MLTDSELDRIRQDAESLLTDTGHVLTVATVPDGAGGQDETYTPGPELACRIAPLSARGDRGLVGEQIDERSTHVATFPSDTTIRSVDRIRVNGTDYAVIALREYGSLAFVRRVEVKEI